MTPTVFLLHAAVHAATCLSRTGMTVDAALSSYRSLATGGLYRADDLKRGETLLLDADLIADENGVLTPSEALLQIREAPVDIAAELILRQFFIAEQPLWLWAAVSGNTLLWEAVPDAEQRLVEHLLDADRREAYLLGIARTVDASALTLIGVKGEDVVADACRRHLTELGRDDLAAKVTRVSAVSDQLGYDVTSPDTGGNRHRLEVKVTPHTLGTVSFFLSRNEATQAARDPMWSLVVVVLDRPDPVAGWCSGNAFLDRLPVDVEPQSARWSSTRVTVNLSDLSPGIPLDSR